MREALGDQAWTAMPNEAREIFTLAGPVVLAEVRGRGLDLSRDAHQFSAEDFAAITQPTLLPEGPWFCDIGACASRGRGRGRRP